MTQEEEMVTHAVCSNNQAVFFHFCKDYEMQNNAQGFKYCFGLLTHLTFRLTGNNGIYAAAVSM